LTTIKVAAGGGRNNAFNPTREDTALTSLTDCMSAHHQACDHLFVAAEEAALAGRRDDCRAATRHFAAAMEAHLRAEEELLFPRCRAANPVAQGPITVMLGEHLLMRELVAQMVAAAEAGDSPAWQDAGDTLVILLQQHNMKEERILYPLCDQSIAAPSALAADLQAILEGPAHA
jgi:iron-sulfur cluster repair protein YtfE (RIC family)